MKPPLIKREDSMLWEFLFEEAKTSLLMNHIQVEFMFYLMSLTQTQTHTHTQVSISKVFKFQMNFRDVKQAIRVWSVEFIQSGIFSSKGNSEGFAKVAFVVKKYFFWWIFIANFHFVSGKRIIFMFRSHPEFSKKNPKLLSSSEGVPREKKTIDFN